MQINDHQSSGYDHYGVISVGGLLNGESVTGLGTCIGVRAGGSTTTTVTLTTSNIRFNTPITPASINFVVALYTARNCPTVQNNDYFQGTAGLTAG